MRRAWSTWKKSPSGFLLLVWWDEFVESGLAARYFCGIQSVGASCPSRPHQRDWDCGFLGLKCVYHNYLILHSQPLDRQGCRSESKQRKRNRSPFFPLKKLKGWFRSGLTLGVNSHAWCEWPQRNSSTWPRGVPSSPPRSGTWVARWKPGVLAVRAPGPRLEEKFPSCCFKQAETAEISPEFIVRDTAP